MSATLDDLLQQARVLRFVDPLLEAEFQAERNAADLRPAYQAFLYLMVMVVVGGLLNAGSMLLGHSPPEPVFLFIRFMVGVPCFGILVFLTARGYSRRHLQVIMGAGVAILIGVFSLESTLEWTPAMPLRMLWIGSDVPYIAVVTLLPLARRTAIWATVGTFVIVFAGQMTLSHQVGLRIIAANVAFFGIIGWLMISYVGGRENGLRQAFLHRREARLLAATLHDQNEALQKLIVQRNDFVASVLHDLRSPLTALTLNAELLREDSEADAAQRDELLENIAVAGKRLGSFANRFLEQRALERASDLPTLARVAFDGMVGGAVENARSKAGAKRQRVVFTNAAPNRAVLADELLFDRALSNLLDNAIKYSPHGATIVVQVAADPAEPARLRASVADAGPGFSEAEQAQLFQPYVKLGKRPTGNEPSAGLGLSLAKHCIEGMGGTVGCESEVGRGATFWVALKVADPV